MHCVHGLPIKQVRDPNPLKPSTVLCLFLQTYDHVPAYQADVTGTPGQGAIFVESCVQTSGVIHKYMGPGIVFA